MHTVRIRHRNFCTDIQLNHRSASRPGACTHRSAPLLKESGSFLCSILRTFVSTLWILHYHLVFFEFLKPHSLWLFCFFIRSFLLASFLGERRRRLCIRDTEAPSIDRVAQRPNAARTASSNHYFHTVSHILEFTPALPNSWNIIQLFG